MSYVTDVSVTFDTVFHYQTSFLRLTCELFFKALIRVCGLFFFIFFFIFKIIITYYYSDIHMMCIRLPICEHFRFPSTQGSLLLVSVFNYSQPAFVIFFLREEDGQISPTSVRCSCTSVLERVCFRSRAYTYICIKQQQTKNKTQLYPRTANRVR